MSFLKKLGTILLSVASTAVGLGPIITPLLGSKGQAVSGEITTVTNDLTSIASVIVQVETAFAGLAGATGAQKLAAAESLVKPIIMTSQMVSGKKIADPAMLSKGISELTQGVVDILNSIDGDATSTEIKA